MHVFRNGLLRNNCLQDGDCQQAQDEIKPERVKQSDKTLPESVSLIFRAHHRINLRRRKTIATRSTGRSPIIRNHMSSGELEFQ
jgi:hypothetical protein